MVQPSATSLEDQVGIPHRRFRPLRGLDTPYRPDVFYGVMRRQTTAGTSNPLRYLRVSMASAWASSTNDSVEGLMWSLRPRR